MLSPSACEYALALVSVPGATAPGPADEPAVAVMSAIASSTTAHQRLARAMSPRAMLSPRGVAYSAESVSGAPCCNRLQSNLSRTQSHDRLGRQAPASR